MINQMLKCIKDFAKIIKKYAFNTNICKNMH